MGASQIIIAHLFPADKSGEIQRNDHPTSSPDVGDKPVKAHVTISAHFQILFLRHKRTR